MRKRACGSFPILEMQALKPHARHGRVTAGLFGTAVLLTVLCGRPAPAEEQEWIPGKYMTQALARVMSGARTITEKGDFGLDDGSTCFMGALLRPGTSVSTGLPLEGGKTYAFIGGGDDDSRDVDLYLQDAAGKVVARDVDDDATPVVTFTPERNGQYRAVLKLESTTARSSFCAYATMRKDGFDVPTQNLTTAAGRLMAMCRVIAEKTGGAGFLDSEGEWALFGTLLTEGQYLTQSGIDLPDGNHAFMAAGDTVARDLDLAVLKGNKQVAEDTDDDANPVCFYRGSGTVSVKLTNVKSNGPTLALAAVLNTR